MMGVVPVPLVANLDLCGTSPQGYYVNGNQTITLCDSSCAVLAMPPATVEYVVGCSAMTVAADAATGGKCTPPIDAGSCGACTTTACCGQLMACQSDPDCNAALDAYWACIQTGGGLTCVDTFTQSAGDASVNSGNLAGQLGNCQTASPTCGTTCGLIIPT